MARKGSGNRRQFRGVEGALPGARMNACDWRARRTGQTGRSPAGARHPRQWRSRARVLQGAEVEAGVSAAGGGRCFGGLCSDARGSAPIGRYGFDLAGLSSRLPQPYRDNGDPVLSRRGL